MYYLFEVKEILKGIVKEIVKEIVNEMVNEVKKTRIERNSGLLDSY